MQKHFIKLLIVFQLITASKIFSQNIALNTTGNLPDTSAMLDVSSTTKGFLLPRMTSVQQSAIPLPATGLIVFNTTANAFQVNTGTPTSPVWQTLGTTVGNWLTGGNSGTNSGSKFVGTTDSVSLRFKTNNTQRLILDSLGNVGVGSSPSFTASPNADKFLVDAGVTNSYNVITAKGNVNNYLQFNVQNESPGSSASSDLVATANNGSETTNYIDMGVNGSGYTGGVMGNFDDAYLFNIGNNLLIGTGSASKALVFMTGGTSQASYERMRIDGSGNVGIGNTAPAATLDVKGTMHLTGSTSGYVGFTSPATAGTTTYTLPSSDGASGQVLSTNGSGTLSWAAGSVATTHTLSSSGNTVTSTVNGVTATANAVNAVANTSSTNTLTTTVNGVAGTSVNIINSHTLSVSGGNLTSTVNGVASTVTLPTASTTNTLASATNTITSTVNGVAATASAVNTVANASSANTLTTTVNGVAGSGVNIINSHTLSSSGNTVTSIVNGVAASGVNIINSNALSVSGSSLTSTVNGVSSTVTIPTASTTNTLASATNTITSTVNGIAATASAVNTVSNTSSANTLTTTVNGVAATGVNIINSNAISLSGTTLTTTVNGIASTPLDISPSIAADAWGLTGNAGTSAGTNFIGTTDANDFVMKTFGAERIRLTSGGYAGIGTSSPIDKLSVVSNTPNSVTALQNTSSSGYSDIDFLTSGSTLGGSVGYGNSSVGGPALASAMFLYGNGGNINITHSSSTYDIFVSGSSGNVGIGVTAPTAALHIKAGTSTASSSPLKFTAGTILSTPEAGAHEYDGVNSYITNETTSGRGAIPVEQHFLLTTAGSPISSIANFFGTTSNIPLASGGYYEIDIYCYFLKTNASTVTWTFTNSAAPTSMDIHYDFSAATGIVSTAAATSLFGDQYNLTSTAPTIVTSSLTSSVDHYAHFKIILLNGTGTSLKIQATSSSGSLTPGIGSRWYCKRISTSNVGTFAN